VRCRVSRVDEDQVFKQMEEFCADSLFRCYLIEQKGDRSLHFLVSMAIVGAHSCLVLRMKASQALFFSVSSLSMIGIQRGEQISFVGGVSTMYRVGSMKVRQRNVV
jgi:hypothetical protein